jgi:hypothetical protein
MTLRNLCVMNADAECPICYEILSGKIQTRFPCRHVTCLNCLAKMRAPPSCPLCRFELKDYLPADPLVAIGRPQPRASLTFVMQRALRDNSISPLPMVDAVYAPETMEPPQPTNARPFLGTLRARPMPLDLLDARVTRNGVFLRRVG